MNYKIACAIITITMVFGCNQDKPEIYQEKTSKTDSTEQDIQVQYESKNHIETFQLKNSDEWGYDIYINGHHTIRQESIPGLPTMRGFKTEEYAKKVEELALRKIENNIFPPSIKKNELDSLAIYI